jgi:hypothetical protein
MHTLDKTAFKRQSLEEADNNRAYWLTKTPEERLAAAMYLNSVAYNFSLENPPRMDKTFFEKRTRN